MVLGKYKLLKNLPELSKGAIFEHRTYDPKHPDRGNMGCGVLILGWVNGNTQGGWCGETFIFPGQLAKNTEWFRKVEDTENIKESLLNQIALLQRQVEKL